MNKPNRQEREWNQRHQEILDAAAPLLLQQGYTGTTMQMIAEKAEFSVGYIYKHFPGKEELIIELIDQPINLYRDLRKRLTEEFSDEPLRIVQETLRQSTEVLKNTAHMLPLLLATDSPGPQRIRKQFQWARQEDAQYLQEAIEQGTMAPCDPNLLAVALDGAFLGLVRKFMENDELHRVIEIPQLLDELIFKPLTRDCPANTDSNERKDPPSA